MIKKLLLVSLIILFGFATSICTAKYSGGNGSESNPYRISNAYDMNDIGAEPNDGDQYALQEQEYKYRYQVTSNELLLQYEPNRLHQFKGIQIADKIVFFMQRRIGDAIVENDKIVYKFDKDTHKLLDVKAYWREDLPAVLPDNLIPKEKAESIVDQIGDTILSSRLYYLSPGSEVFPIKPSPENPCWVVRSLNDYNSMNLAVIDAITGKILGYGTPPPTYTAFASTGPIFPEECSQSWLSWCENAEYWFDEMGYNTEKVIWPSQEQVKSHIQSKTTAMFYEIGHGGSYNFTNSCLDGTTYDEIHDWIIKYTKMPFAFIASCDGLCDTGQETLSYELSKGSDDNTAIVGYCGMSTDDCAQCWNQSISWQTALFSYMSQGMTVKDAFDQANIDYPQCAYYNCMRFTGDENFSVVPLVTRVDKLLAHWKFDEAYSTIANDSAGDNTGTIYGSEWTDGKLNYALSFDGVNDCINCGNDPNLMPVLPISVSAWIRMTGSDKSMNIVTVGTSVFASAGFWFQVNEENKLVFAYGDDGGIGDLYVRKKVGTTTLNTDTWYHVAVVVRGAEDMDLYINGADDGGTYYGSGDDLAYADGDFTIGNDITYGPSTTHFKGIIDDVCFFNIALTAEEVEALYDVLIDYIDLNFLADNWLAITLQQQQIGDLIGWWQFDDGDGNTAADSSGYVNTGTLYNEPNWHNKVLEFDGIDDYVQTADDANKLQLTGSYTLSVWLKADAVQSDWAGILAKCAAGIGKTPNHWSLLFGGPGVPDTTGKLVVWNGILSSTRWDTEIELSDISGSWHHIAVVRSMTTMVSYLDGRMVSHGTYESDPNGGYGHLNIGAERTTRSCYKGLIGDVSIYDYQLTSDEVRELSLEHPVGQLVGWWNFDDGTADDSSGNGHHGTFMYDATTVIDGNIAAFDANNKALLLDGTDDYVNLGGGGSGGTWADMNDAMSIACWIKLPDGYTNDYQPAVAKSGSWLLYRNYNGYGIRFFTTNTTDTYINYNPPHNYPYIYLDDGQWHHVAATFNSEIGIRHIYIDGYHATAEAVAGTIAKSTYDLAIGARLAYTNRWQGLIDDVRLYDYVLSPSAVEWLYEGSPAPEPVDYLCIERPIGDMNGDCKVDHRDFDVLASNWLESNL